MTLFEDDFGRIEPPAPVDDPRGHDYAQIVRVVPDVPAMDRALDYAVPEKLIGKVTMGCVVRVPLHGRRVRGWVVETDVAGGPGRRLHDVTKVTGLALDAETIELARWVAWRWVGRLPTIMRSATADRAVPSISRREARNADRSRVPTDLQNTFDEASRLLERGAGTHLYSSSPCTDHTAVALAAATRGQALIISPSAEQAAGIANALARCGATVVRWPGGTAGAMAGHSVVGGHIAAMAPMPGLAAIVVLDEHDERLQNESSPTWHAREVAVERGRRAGIPCLLVSPMPSLEAQRLATSPPLRVATGARRSGWARLVVVDRRDDDPRNGLFSPRFAEAARRVLDAGQVAVCVLNRTGRSRLLACRSCDSIATCEVCGAAVKSSDDEVLDCMRCGSSRPKVCLNCGSHGMKVLRMGVTRAREDLGALLGRSVGLVTATQDDARGEALVVGTAAVLNLRREYFPAEVGLVAFLDFDQELLAPRYRASEQALGQLVSGSRLAGGREGSVLVQTRDPDHEVIKSAVASDPMILSAAELPRREMLGLPPAGSIAAVGGEAAGEWIRRFEELPAHGGVSVQGPNEGWWMVRSEDLSALLEAANAVKRPSGRLRLRVDPMQLPTT